MDDRLGTEKHDGSPGSGSRNSCDGKRTKTVLTEIAQAEVDVPRDAGSTFEPRIIKERPRCLPGGGRRDRFVAERDGPHLGHKIGVWRFP